MRDSIKYVIESYISVQICSFVVSYLEGRVIFKAPLALHENKNFRLTKICEKDRKDHIFISFRMFPFHGNIIFSEFSFKRKCKKAASFCKCVFLRKYEIFVFDSRA